MKPTTLKPTLSIDAASFMLKSDPNPAVGCSPLVARNDQYPRDAPQEKARYAVPLHTVVDPEPFMPESNFKREIETLCSDVDRDFNLFFTPLEKLRQLSEPELEAHFQRYLNQLRTFIKPHTLFGLNFRGTFNYELIIARNNSTHFDSFGDYPTGGRSRLWFTPENTLYTIKFTPSEQRFFINTLAGRQDSTFDSSLNISLNDLPNITRDSIRYIACNQLCTEIIISKLVIFLNSLGKEKTNTLDGARLTHLLRDSIDSVQDTLLEFAQGNGVYTIRHSCPPSHYKVVTEASPTTKKEPTTDKQFSYLSFLLVAAIGAGASLAAVYLIKTFFPDTLPDDPLQIAIPAGLAFSVFCHRNNILPKQRPDELLQDRLTHP